MWKKLIGSSPFDATLAIMEDMERAVTASPPDAPMQMAKSVAALERFREKGLPFISVLLHPTTGGVAGSFAFLGDVNLFHGRVEGQTLRIAQTTLNVPIEASEEGEAQVYVRPPRLTLQARPTGRGKFPAIVQRVNSAGPLRAHRPHGRVGRAPAREISEERYRALGLDLQRGSQVFVGMLIGGALPWLFSSFAIQA